MARPIWLIDSPECHRCHNSSFRSSDIPGRPNLAMTTSNRHAQETTSNCADRLNPGPPSAGSRDRSPAGRSSSGAASARRVRTPTRRSGQPTARPLPGRASPSSTRCPRRSRATGPPRQPVDPMTSPERRPHAGTRPGTSLDDPSGPPSSRVSPRIRCPPQRGNSITQRPTVTRPSGGSKSS